MELLHSTTGASGDARGLNLSCAVNPLIISSGNVRSFTTGSRDGIENQLPLPMQAPVYGSKTKIELPLPAPSMKLSSNNTPKSRPRRSNNRRRTTGILNDDRPYLRHPKYLEYRARPRQDIGPDGKPIWPKHVETAFQNALVSIPPMGRKKCSQRGKPFGRNMLIAEWIFQETGEIRARKQVSSHIQVLDRFLKGIPEWDRLMKAPKASPEGYKFYHNSIEHMVNEYTSKEKSLSRQGMMEDEIDDRDASLGSGNMSGAMRRWSVSRLHFEMWVSLPDLWERALHNYTRLESVQRRALPLNDHLSWRHSFPHLPPIIDDPNPFSCPEMILLRANFQLMDDFPPRHSKLGIGLELDFGRHDGSSFPSLYIDGYHEWTSVTHIYQDGLPMTGPVREECRISEHGTVKPFFQSKWWASAFTSLTEARKVAEDSKDPHAVALADEQAHTFFQSLTIMQEITACGPSQGRPTRRKPQPPQRIAVLLWEFAQAPPGTAGVTTWQLVTPQHPAFDTSGALPATTDMELPSLEMDITEECSTEYDFNNSKPPYLPDHSMGFEVFPETIEEEVFQDGFMPFKSGSFSGFGNLHPSFQVQSPRSFLPNSNIDAFEEVFSGGHGLVSTTAETRPIEPASAFDLHALSFPHPSHGLPPSETREEIEPESVLSNVRQHQRLTVMDFQPHQASQRHLASEGELGNLHRLPKIYVNVGSGLPPESAGQDWTTIDEFSGLELELPQKQDFIFREAEWMQERRTVEQVPTARPAGPPWAAFGAHPTLTPVDRGVDALGGEFDHEHNDALWLSPTSLRPALHSYHSFPGLSSGESQHNLGSSLQKAIFDQPEDGIAAKGLLEHRASRQPAQPLIDDAADSSVDASSRRCPRAQSEPDPVSVLLFDALHGRNSPQRQPIAENGERRSGQVHASSIHESKQEQTAMAYSDGIMGGAHG